MSNSPLENCTTNTSTSSMPSVDVLDPTPRINLNNVDGVRREMSRVYKDMRAGSVSSQDGARLVYVLGELRKMFEICELEKRIEGIESHPHYKGGYES